MIRLSHGGRPIQQQSARRRRLSTLEAQRYVNTTIEAIELMRLARNNPGVEIEDLLHMVRGSDGGLDYASYGAERPFMSVADTWNRDESCPRQWPGASNRDPEAWHTYCNADPRQLPGYYVTEDRWGNPVCYDCRLYRWWAWVQQEFGAEMYRELFGRRGPVATGYEVVGMSNA